MSLTMIEEKMEYPLVRSRYREEATGYLVILEGDDKGWSAYLPDLPGVVSAGATEEEVRRLISEAVDFHLEGMRADGEPIPAPASHAYRV